MQDFESKRKELSRAEAELEREKYLNEVVSPVLGQNPKGEDEDLNEENHMRSFVNYLRNGSIDNILKRNVLNESTAEQGGILVPTTLQSKIREKLNDLSVIRKIATVQKALAIKLYLFLMRWGIFGLANRKALLKLVLI